MLATTDPIELLLKGQYPDTETGAKIGVSVESVVIADSLEGQEVELVSNLGFGHHLALVCDPDTFEAMGKRLEKSLSSRFKIQRLVLERHPHPDETTLQKLTHALDSRTEGVIAVGSGTINDLCKMAAYRKGCPQAVFGTAPSMNGYTSVNAAITVGGLKKSLHAAAPRGVFLDLRVLANAPRRLIQSGLGDSLCRPTAQADWLLAHLIWDQPYRETPFALLREDEEPLFSQSAALLSGDLSVMRRLARTLVLSGFGMTICGGSYPASQAEHLISHYIDMLGGSKIPESFHGEQIGVTTLVMARIQEKFLHLENPPKLKPSSLTQENFLAHYGEKLGHACWKEFEPKRLDASKADELNARLEKNWSSIRERIQKATIPSEQLLNCLAAAAAPRTPQDLGWPESIYNDALMHAREIRNRYTFLDFAADAEKN